MTRRQRMATIYYLRGQTAQATAWTSLTSTTSTKTELRPKVPT